MKTLIQYFLLGVFFVSIGETNAQDCGCDHVIKDFNNPFFKGDVAGVQPGDRICIMKTDQALRFLHIKNITGTAENPVTIINCGGQVTIGKEQHNLGVIVENSKYFRFTGTGDPDIKYGFLVDGIPNNASGIAVSSLSTDFELDHIEVKNVGGAGFHVVQKPSCDVSTQRGNFTQRNLKIHDNYIHEMGAEGFYIGHSNFSSGLNVNCDGQATTVFPINIENIEFYNNRIINVGQDGCQLSTIVKGARIYSNTIINYGQKKIRGQSAGIVIGGGTGTDCRVYNNWIENGHEGGIHVFGTGGINIFNNVVIDSGLGNDSPGLSAILFGNKSVIENQSVQAINNTIVNPRFYGILMNHDRWVSNEFYNNVIINPGLYDVLPAKKYRAYIEFNGDVEYDSAKNYFTQDINSAGFENPNSKKFYLKDGSVLANSGRDVSEFGVTFDFFYYKRGIDGNYSKGAFEYGTEVITGVEGDHPLSSGNTLDLTVSPNPYSSGELQLTINMDKSEIGSLEIFSVDGKEIVEIFKNERLKEGNNNFKVDLKKYLDDFNAETFVLLYFKSENSEAVKRVILDLQ